ncbi:hypothetical protein KFE25_003945 [Diacronema lutheri]|uniref:Uncharacterized protein n=1 Tax=Diacronema lutheri TaxID=2081491 RepID=A0A8J6C6L4_DIALT|nr:hypothetical protein KFE25_003945 [Diacronema lutheri]
MRGTSSPPHEGGADVRWVGELSSWPPLQPIEQVDLPDASGRSLDCLAEETLAIDLCLGNRWTRALKELREEADGVLEEDAIVVRVLAAAVDEASAACVRARVAAVAIAVALWACVITHRARIAMHLSRWAFTLGVADALFNGYTILTLMGTALLDLAAYAALVLALLLSAPRADASGGAALPSVARRQSSAREALASVPAGGSPPSGAHARWLALVNAFGAPAPLPRCLARTFLLQPWLALATAEVLLASQLLLCLFEVSWLVSVAFAVWIMASEDASIEPSPGLAARHETVLVVIVSAALLNVTSGALTAVGLWPLLRARMLAARARAAPPPDGHTERAWRMRIAWRALALYGIGDVTLFALWRIVLVYGLRACMPLMLEAHASSADAGEPVYARFGLLGTAFASSVALTLPLAILGVLLAVVAAYPAARAFARARVQCWLGRPGSLCALAPIVGFGGSGGCDDGADGARAGGGVGDVEGGVRELVELDPDWARPVLLTPAALDELCRVWSGARPSGLFPSSGGAAAAVSGPSLARAGGGSDGEHGASSRAPLARAPAGAPIDRYCVHAWQDCAAAKLSTLRAFAAEFVLEHGRVPAVWLDALCAPPPARAPDARARGRSARGADDAPADGAAELARMPRLLGRSRGLLILVGPAFYTRLWCALEVYTWFALGGTLRALTMLVVPTPTERFGKGGIADRKTLPAPPLLAALSGFSASRATAASAAHRRQLRLAVQLAREWRVNAIINLLGRHVHDALKAAHWSNACAVYGISGTPRGSRATRGSGAGAVEPRQARVAVAGLSEAAGARPARVLARTAGDARASRARSGSRIAPDPERGRAGSGSARRGARSARASGALELAEPRVNALGPERAPEPPPAAGRDV